ncbi:MAG TPA: lactate racemase domain-containing protein [Acidobacteriaceae bacterium]|nr:lactate racemase domain-containing protein [Acidobacteriaceae bacterium]
MDNADHFPRMHELRQHYPASPSLDFPSVLREQFAHSGVLAKVTPGMRIAVGVGSRGISNLAAIVKAALEILKGAGAQPFILPAMGSHGGATAEGQEKVLAEYGVTREAMGVPFETSMEVRQIGTTPDGRDVVLSLPALQADGIVVINRVKPHTDFHGDLGSGLQKMLTIGFGKQAGAANAHGAASRLGHEAVIRAFAKVILEAAPVLCGVAIIEDQHHQTAELRVIEAAKIIHEEEKLLLKARSLMASLPFQEIDLLIIDQIGKEISGTGMDTNVIGRSILGYSVSLKRDSSMHPQIFRIFVRDLTEATKGNGIGIGLADFTTSRVVRALNLQYTYMNAITSLGILPAKIPIYYDNDREALRNAFASLVAPQPDDLRIVRIVDTLNLDRMLVSGPLAQEAHGRKDLSLGGEAAEMAFDGSGNLLPF